MIAALSELFVATLLETIRDLTPIVVILLFFQFVVLRGPLITPARVLRGFLFVVLGMVLFLMGLEKAIFPLGEVMAKQLTDPEFLFAGTDVILQEVRWQDYGWVYAFAFAIGLSTTLAEPALIAVGMKAEEVSGGSISAWGLRLAVSLGVAVGVTIGCYRIVTGTDLWLYIISAYVVVIVQTIYAPRMIIPMAYDSGGVTTSTVTVPLLAALGLGLASSIPGRSPLIDGFGLIAFASVFPIMSVMGYAQFTRWLNRERSKEESDAF
jgi:hypothetical protein